jgi:DNA-directed RNA polymerase specialized sigma24 family protein
MQPTVPEGDVMNTNQTSGNLRSYTVQRLHVALDDLSPEKRVAVHLRFWENWEIAEISRLLGKSWSATDCLIESTLRELRSSLGPKNYVPYVQESLTNSISIGD